VTVGNGGKSLVTHILTPRKLLCTECGVQSRYPYYGRFSRRLIALHACLGKAVGLRKLRDITRRAFLQTSTEKGPTIPGAKPYQYLIAQPRDGRADRAAGAQFGCCARLMYRAYHSRNMIIASLTESDTYSVAMYGLCVVMYWKLGTWITVLERDMAEADLATKPPPQDLNTEGRFGEVNRAGTRDLQQDTLCMSHTCNERYALCVTVFATTSFCCG
jgi:hypothetical protein